MSIRKSSVESVRVDRERSEPKSRLPDEEKGTRGNERERERREFSHDLYAVIAGSLKSRASDDRDRGGGVRMSTRAFIYFA